MSDTMNIEAGAADLDERTAAFVAAVLAGDPTPATRTVAEQLALAVAGFADAHMTLNPCALAAALGLDPHMPVADLELWRDCFEEVAGAGFQPGMDHPAMRYIDVQVTRVLHSECQAAASRPTRPALGVVQPVSQSLPATFEEACEEQCPCERCNPWSVFTESFARRPTRCPTCGNKRCPKGTDHALVCTGSDEPGQPGSSWAHLS